MDNKPSELSKPVAWRFKNADGGDRVSLERKANIYGRHDFQPLYSQEYVSALDEIAQHWIGESAGWKQRAEDAEKRIAELEAGHQEAAKQIATWRRISKQNIEEREKDLAALDAERQKITGLEAKLATPVRLPEPYQTSCGESERYLCPVEVAEAIRAAGFKVEGGE